EEELCARRLTGRAHDSFMSHRVSPWHLSFNRYGELRDLHSFPTRRSSDLEFTLREKMEFIVEGVLSGKIFEFAKPANVSLWKERSEEHTSELQSRFDLVCRLLLEKKKQ